MSATISITCAKCKKKLKAPEKLKGKKIRCKGCGETLTVGERAAVKAAASEKKPHETDEWGDVSGYGIHEVSLKTRCPFCALELESDEAVVCLHCGYSLQARERLKPLVLHGLSVMDWTLWLTPGIICAIGALIFAGFIACIWLDYGLPEWLFWVHEWLWARVWSSVICAFIGWGFGYFAYKRLVKHPRPPEKEIKKGKDDE